jgi:tight adherence protein B
MTRIVMVALVILVIVTPLILFLTSGGSRKLQRRARRVANAPHVGRMAPGPQLRLDRPGGLDAVVMRFLPRPALLRQRLASSGVALSIGAYVMICATFAMSAAIITLVENGPLLMALLVGVASGLIVPHMALGFMVERRRKKFAKLFPDAIGLIVRGLKAGLPAIESMLIVGREVGPPVGEEFRRIGDQVRVGQSIEDALWSVARRLDLQEFNFLVITMAIQRETGGNLAETLENLDEMLRKRHQMKLKVKAMSSEATATAMIIGSMPFAMGTLLFIVSRPYIMTLFNTGLGHILLGCAITWMCFGFFVMSRMISFEI